MLNKLLNKLHRRSYFDMVVMAFVLQFPDMRRIQGELAYKLDMKFEEETLQERADRLYQRMMEEKSILIILEFLHIYRLDNVEKIWEKTNFLEILFVN